LSSLFAGRLLTLKLAFGLGAESGLLAFPVASSLFAFRNANRLGGNALGVAFRSFANSFAFGAVFLLAHILGAMHTAGRALAVNCALGAFRLFAFHLAFRALANRMALCRALWVVALPFAKGMALGSIGNCSHDG